MIYSCFNERLGEYEYFRDDRTNPINGDLPVPDLASKQAGRVGVPARDAARSLPGGAKRIGKGWNARGIIVQCNNLPTRGLGAAMGGWALHPWIVVAGGALAMYGAWQLYLSAMEEWGRRPL